MTAKHTVQQLAAGLVALIVFCPGLLFAQAPGPWAPPGPLRPPVRDETCLNGTWNFRTQEGVTGQIPVPEYWDSWGRYETSVGTYERVVSVPSTWTNKCIKLDFEGVAQLADVYVDEQLVKSHVGGWLPFSADVTSLVTARDMGTHK